MYLKTLNTKAYLKCVLDKNQLYLTKILLCSKLISNIAKSYTYQTEIILQNIDLGFLSWKHFNIINIVWQAPSLYSAREKIESDDISDILLANSIHLAPYCRNSNTAPRLLVMENDSNLHIKVSHGNQIHESNVLKTPPKND